MTLMLASVSDLAEAELALGCGVDWIDVKDPAAGALGAAPLATVRSIVRYVAGRVPVSATLGDTWHEPDAIAPASAAIAASGVDFVKAGLDARAPGARTLAALSSACAGRAAIILVCMAESAPSLPDLDVLATSGIAGLMLDTAHKSGPRLPQILGAEYLHGFVATARRHRLLSGLAGRLRRADIGPLLGAGADYLGFRSALCDDGNRRGRLSRAATVAIRNALTAGDGRSNHTNCEVA